MEPTAFRAIRVALILALGSTIPAPATPPPPPPPEARASFEAIDRLHFLEGDWEGTQLLGDTSINVAVARQVGRFGRGMDHLLIGSLSGYSDRQPRRPLEGSDIISHSLEILTFDPIRGGYWIYAPGFFGERQSSERGREERVDLELIGPAELILRQRLSNNRERTIHVIGDRWEETLVYLRPGAPSEPILATHLTRFLGVTEWGVVSRP
jgi:hypothetical protein